MRLLGNESKVGLIALAIKLGPKLLSLVVKLAKGLKVGKVGLAGASMAAYSVMFSWQFAAMIMLLLIVHEGGHLWAMKRCGMKVKGMYFIPFIGAAAVPDEEFPSRKDEVVVAIMGPIWGFALSAAMGVVYAITGSVFFGAAAGWMALINLFNLLPISPLDGGRIVKSIFFSVHNKLGLVFLFLGIIVSVVLSVTAGLVIFALLAVIATIEFSVEAKKVRSEYGEAIREREHLAFTRERWHDEIWFDKSRHAVWANNVEKVIKQYQPMSRSHIFASAGGYFCTILVLYGLMAYMKNIPAVAEALKMLA